VPLERLGQTQEWGEVLVGLLEQAGWRITQRELIDGGVVLTATGCGTSVSAAGDTSAAAAAPLFERVMALKRWRTAA
jgi:hypothetical protein